MGVHQALNAPPSVAVMLVPRQEAFYVVGENRFGLVRVLKFSTWSHAEIYLQEQSLKIPQISPAHLQPMPRQSTALAGHRLTWFSANHPKHMPTPVVETPDDLSAREIKKWIESGNLRGSHLGYAIPLEPASAASFDP